MEEGTKRKLKIAAVIVAIVVVIAIVWYMMKDPASKGEKPYVDNVTPEKYSAFWESLVANICPNPSVNNCEGLARGYLKVNNLAMSPANVKMFATEIKAYVAAPASKPHWDIPMPTATA